MEQTIKQTTSETKEQPTQKSLSGKEENSWWENIADSIAGDNKMLNGGLKTVLNPLVLTAGGAAAYYIHNLKEEIKQLKQENGKLMRALEEKEKDYRSLKKKYKKYKEQHEKSESSLNELGFIPQQALPPVKAEAGKTYKSAYLD